MRTAKSRKALLKHLLSQLLRRRGRRLSDVRRQYLFRWCHFPRAVKSFETLAMSLRIMWCCPKRSHSRFHRRQSLGHGKHFLSRRYAVSESYIYDASVASTRRTCSLSSRRTRNHRWNRRHESKRLSACGNWFVRRAIAWLDAPHQFVEVVCLCCGN